MNYWIVKIKKEEEEEMVMVNVILFLGSIIKKINRNNINKILQKVIQQIITKDNNNAHLLLMN